MLNKILRIPSSRISLRKNIAANFSASIWQGIMGIVFFPLYIKFMGIESYGLIGIFATLQVIFGLLDVGLGSTLNREMARLSVLPGKEQEMRNLVRTLESIYWCLAVFAGLSVVTLSPFIAHQWINTNHLTPAIVEQTLVIMGFVMIFQMPIGFYSGGLMGLQKQVLLNVINVIISTLRGVVTVLILWLVSPTIQAFLLLQLIFSIINGFVLARFLWNSLPHSENSAEFKLQLLNGVFKFTVGMSGISILAVVLTQLDKAILCKLLSLEMFGYYMLANMVAMNLGRLFTPVFFSIYPIFTQLASINNQDELERFYHVSCQFIAVLILPVAIVIALFSYEVMLLWTQNHKTADNTHLILSIMICGTALNGLMNPPYALQLAFGWTKLSVIKNIFALILLVPLIIYSTLRYGAIGAASVWLILNLGYVFIEIPIMHQRLLPKEKWRWYWHDVTVPLIAGLTVAGIGRFFSNGLTSFFIMFLYLFVTAVLTLFITIIFVPTMRTRFFRPFFKNL